jgi:RNA polymerase sigma factor (sigma-70 family)
LQENNEVPGSQSGLNAWVRASWPRAVVYARSLLHDHPAAEDVVQDCFCNLLRKADVYDLPRDGVPLLMKSVTNACLKKITRARPTISLNADAPGADGAPNGIDPVDASGAEPPRIVLYAELERAIEAALAELPEVQRAAIELKGLGHSLREIAAILEVSTSNAGVMIHRGRQTLAQQLAPFLESTPDEQTGKRSTS